MLYRKRFYITAISREEGHIDLFLCGPDGHVYTVWWKSEPRWSKHTDVGGDFPPGAKVTAVSRDPEKLDIFLCDINGSIHTSWWHLSVYGRLFPWATSWAKWERIGDQFFGGTEVIAILRGTDAIHLFALAEDRQIYTLQWTPRGGGWPENRCGNPLPQGPQIFFGMHIEVAARTENHLDLFVCDGDGSVMTLGWSDPTGWTDWNLIGQGFSTELEIAAIAPNEKTLEIFACQPNGRIYTTHWTIDQGWKLTWDWISLGANFRAESKVIVVELVPEGLRLFVHGSDGFIHTSWCSGLRSEWSEWQLIEGQTFSGAVDLSAIVPKGGRAVDLFVTNNEGERLSIWWTRGSRQSWESWRIIPLL